MNLYIQKASNGYQYVKIIQGYRDPKTKKPTYKVIEKVGRLDKLLAEDPNIIEKLTVRVEEMNAQEELLERQNAKEKIEKLLKPIPDSGNKKYPSRNFGYLLYKNVWDELNLDSFFCYRQKKWPKLELNLRDMTFLQCVSRIITPCSKLATYKKQNQFLEHYDFKEQNFYRVLPYLATLKEPLEKYLHKKICEQTDRDMAVVFYDVTTYYFESVTEDALKGFGFSKDNKVNLVQVVMGLLIDNNGIPVGYDLFPGNTSDFSTLKPILSTFKKKYGVNKVIITADRGLNSKSNLLEIKKMGFGYIMAYKIRSSSAEMKGKVLDPEGYTTFGENYKYKVLPYENIIKDKETKEPHRLKEHIIVSFSSSRYIKDQKDRERLIEKAERLVSRPSNYKSEMKKGGKKYIDINLNGKDIQINWEKIKKEQLLDGYYAIETSELELPAEEIINIYRKLWKIEESFRVMKTQLQARPIYVWTKANIEGHFVMCYLALVLQRMLEYKLDRANLKITTDEIIAAVTAATITIVDDDNYMRLEDGDTFDKMLEALKLPQIPSPGKVNRLKKQM